MNSQLISLNFVNGLGDLLRHYFIDSDIQFLSLIKESHPDVRVRINISSSNGNTYQLFKHNPYVDEICIHKWSRGVVPSTQYRNTFCSKLSSLEITDFITDEMRKTPLDVDKFIYLSKTEKEQLNDLKKEKYIVIHPFAGDPRRACFKDHLGKYPCFSEIQYAKIAEKCIQNGYKVFIIGNPDYTTPGRFRSEVWSYKVDNLTCLSGLTSIPFNLSLIKDSIGFFGTNSSMAVAAVALKRPAIVFYSHTKGDKLLRIGVETKNLAASFVKDSPFSIFYSLPTYTFDSLKIDDIWKGFEGLLNVSI